MPTIFAHAKRLNQIAVDPAEGQRKFTVPQAKRRLRLDEIARLRAAMREAAADHEKATGIAPFAFSSSPDSGAWKASGSDAAGFATGMEPIPE